MISVRLYKRRKRIVTLLWIAACVLGVLAATGARTGSTSGATSGGVAPVMAQNEPDAPQTTPATPAVNGDGVLDTPGVVVKLVPALTNEAAEALKDGDAREALSQFCRWIASGEALRSESFWLFWSIMGAGVVAVICCSLVQHFMEWRRRVDLHKAGGPDDTVQADEDGSTE